MQYKGLNLREHKGHFYFEDLELAQKHDPKKPGNYNAFIKNYDLVVSSAVSPSINHLLKGRIGNKKIGGGYTQKTIYDDMKDYPDELGWFDHTNLFYHSGSHSYALTTQPYDLRLEQFKALEAFCEKRGLSCAISYEDAWWYPGSAPLIIICRSEVMPIIFSDIFN